MLSFVKNCTYALNCLLYEKNNQSDKRKENRIEKKFPKID